MKHYYSIRVRHVKTYPSGAQKFEFRKFFLNFPACLAADFTIKDGFAKIPWKLWQEQREQQLEYQARKNREKTQTPSPQSTAGSMDHAGNRDRDFFLKICKVENLNEDEIKKLEVLLLKKYDSLSGFRKVFSKEMETEGPFDLDDDMASIGIDYFFTRIGIQTNKL